MDRYEATKVVFSRIQNLDPDNASKIMGLLLIQDHGEKEMIRLAFGPDNLLHTIVLKARQELGITSSSNTPSSTPSTPSSPSPFPCTTTATSTTNNHHHPLYRESSTPSSRLFLPNGLKIPSSLSVSSLASPSSAANSPSWGHSVFSDYYNPDELFSPSSSSMPSADLIDETQLQEQFSFLNDPHPGPDGSGSGGGDPLIFPYSGASPRWGGQLHRRSYSVSDVSIGGTDDPGPTAGGLGWKPCLYYARGYCKNGAACRFLHHHVGGLGSADPDSVLVGSPTTTSKVEAMEKYCHELLRSKSMQHHKLLAATAAAAAGRSSSFSYKGSKTLDFILQQQQCESPRIAAAAAMMMGEDINTFNRSRLSIGEFSVSGGADSNPGSRQIYLTFPADSTFREEDVSSYFSIYGPVQDVRIPYQQKRMFGFVTFLYPGTVKIILAKGNPHFVCDSRVLVKPYKEKGKVPDKFRKQQLQQLERGDFSACGSPTGLDSRDPFDHPLGARMMYNNNQDLFLRRKLEEQADLQQALELQSKRLIGLTLDVKRSHHHRALSTGAAPFPSPSSYSPSFSQTYSISSSDRSSPDGCQEDGSTIVIDNEALQSQIGIDNRIEKERLAREDSSSSNGKESSLQSHDEDNDKLPESLDHNLPDSPFASPTKGASESLTAWRNIGNDTTDHARVASSAPTSASNNNNSKQASATSSLDMTPFKSCYFQMPSWLCFRLSTGHGAIGM